MEWSPVTVEPGFRASLLQSIVKLSQSSVGIFDTNPHHLRFSMRRKPAASAHCQFEWLGRCSSGSRRLRNSRYLRHRSIPQKFQCEVKIILSTPTCPNVGSLASKMVNVFDNLDANLLRNLDGDEGANGIHRLHRLHR